MARRKRSRRRRSRGFGSVITMRRTRGLGRLNNPNSLMGAAAPPLLGVAVLGLTTTAALRWGGRISATIPAYANWIGLAVALLGSAALGHRKLGGKSAGIAMASAAVGTVATSWAAMQLATVGAGTGAIVAEYGSGMRGLPARGTGAIVMEPAASRGYGMQGVGSYGEEISLGNVSPSAFGTPGFCI